MPAGFEGASDVELSEQMLAVGMVLAILGGGLWVLKRKGFAQSRLRRMQPSSEPRLELVDRLALSPQHSLHMVRVGERTLLVGLSPGGCNLLECTSSATLPRRPENT